MNIVEKYSSYKTSQQTHQPDVEKPRNIGTNFAHIKKTLSADVRNKIKDFKDKYGEIKEVVIYNIMKKHEFKYNLAENDIKMLVINNRSFKSDNNFNFNFRNKQNGKVVKKAPKKRKEEQNGDYEKKENGHLPKENGHKAKEKYTSNYQQVRNRYKASKERNGYSEYKQKKMKNKPKKQVNRQRDTSDYEYVQKERSVSQKDNKTKETKSEHVDKPKNDTAEVILEPERAEPQQTQNEQEPVENKSYTSFEQPLNRMFFLVENNLFTYFQHLRTVSKEFQQEEKTAQEPEKQIVKATLDKRYKKQPIEIIKEFKNDFEESSANIRSNKIDKLIKKKFESEDEKLKTDREKKLEKKVNDLSNIINTMQERINQMETELVRVKNGMSFDGQTNFSTNMYCMVPFSAVKDLFTPIDPGSNPVVNDPNLKCFTLNRSES